MNIEFIYAAIFCVLCAITSVLLVKFNVVKVETSMNTKVMLFGLGIVGFSMLLSIFFK